MYKNKTLGTFGWMLCLCVGWCTSLHITNSALPTVVKAGSDTQLLCQADTKFESCTWTLPNQVTCGPLSVDGHKQCRTRDNIDFVGDSETCKIRIRNTNEDENGLWTCSLATSDGEPVEASVSLTVMVKAVVELRHVVGTLYAQVGESTPVLTCDAKHTRPMGKFVWHLGEDHSNTSNQIRNSLPIQKDITRNDGIINVWQDLRYEPLPEHNNKILYCTYIQEDSMGREIFTENAQIGLKVLYLKESKSNILIPTITEGETLNVSIKFEAVPRPENKDIIWEIESEDDVIIKIALNESEVTKENYVASPLMQTSEHEFTAHLKIINITFGEASKSHSLRIINRAPSNKSVEVLHYFNVNVDRPWYDDPHDDGKTPPTQTANLVISTIIIIVIIAVAVLGVLYLKREQKFCFRNNAPYIPTQVQEQREPLKETGTMVQHHPYGRPT